MKNVKKISIKLFMLCLLIIIGFSYLSLTTNSYSPPVLEKANLIASKGIIENNSSNPTNYRLGDSITRKETMKIIIKLSGLEVNNQCGGNFGDVSNDWGCKYIEKALVSGFISKNNYFRPDDSITKIEVIKLILKAKGIEKIQETSNWQKDYIETAYKNGIINKKYTDYDTVVTRGWIFYAIANTYNESTNDSSLDNGVIEEKNPEVIENYDNKTSLDIFSNKLITIQYNGITVDAYVNKSEGLSKNEKVDVIVAYHGTAILDSKILHAAESLATKVRTKILNNSGRNIVIFSIAYKEEGILIGDNIIESEAAFLRVKNNAAKELNLNIDKVFLFGHSLGGYLVTRLNTMHSSDGVIANAPGPLDLVLRCKQDEKSLNEYKEPPKEAGIVCYNLYQKYGSVNKNPTEYINRSGLNYVSGYKSDILFIQGQDDPNPFQKTSWPKFMTSVQDNSHEGNYTFLNLEGFEHGAVFDSDEAKAKVVDFLK